MDTDIIELFEDEEEEAIATGVAALIEAQAALTKDQKKYYCQKMLRIPSNIIHTLLPSDSLIIEHVLCKTLPTTRTSLIQITPNFVKDAPNQDITLLPNLPIPTEAFVKTVANVGLISYISVQVYYHLHGTQFQARPDDQTQEMFRYAHLSQSEFLCILQAKPLHFAGGLKLEPQDYTTYLDLKRQEKKIISVMKKRRARRGNA
jgi:hypothetical protein